MLDLVCNENFKETDPEHVDGCSSVFLKHVKLVQTDAHILLTYSTPFNKQAIIVSHFHKNRTSALR